MIVTMFKLCIFKQQDRLGAPKLFCFYLLLCLVQKRGIASLQAFEYF